MFQEQESEVQSSTAEFDAVPFAASELRQRILVVEDEPMLREILGIALRGAGYDVTEVENGDLALHEVGKEPFHLILCDIVMPERDGLQTLMDLRAANDHTPVIAMSGGYTHAGLYLGIAQRLGASAVLSKPFSIPDLLRRVRECSMAN